MDTRQGHDNQDSREWRWRNDPQGLLLAIFALLAFALLTGLAAEAGIPPF